MNIQGLTPSQNIFDINTENTTKKSEGSSGFGQVFKNMLDDLNEKQLKSDELTNKLVLGEDVEVHEVMLAAEEAGLALQMAVQVRNKVTEAIKELTNLQI